MFRIEVLFGVAELLHGSGIQRSVGVDDEKFAGFEQEASAVGVQAQLVALRSRGGVVKVGPYLGLQGPGRRGVGVRERGEQWVRVVRDVPCASMFVNQRLVEIVSPLETVLEDPLQLAWIRPGGARQAEYEPVRISV